MKNLKIWSLAVAILMVVTGCGETTSTGDTFKPGDVSKIVNEWQLIEWGGAEAQFDVYIKFDGANVVLYQRFAADYEKYEGTYTLNGKVLSGKYTDGKDFGPYDAEVSADGKTLRLHKDDVMGVYAATTIPAWVKDFAVVGGANENEGTEGDGTEGDGTEGDGTEGDGTEGDGTEGDGTEGDGTEGGDTTEGEGTEGGDTTEGEGTEGGDTTEGEGTEGGDTTEGEGTEGGDTTEGEGTEGDDTTEGGEEQNPAPGTTACRFVGVPFL